MFVEQVVLVERGCGIFLVYLEGIIKLLDIVFVVGRQEEVVFVVCFLVDFGIQVVEDDCCVVQLFVVVGVQVGIGVVACQDKGSFVFYNWLFNGVFCCQNVDVVGVGKLFGVVVLGGYFQQGRQLAFVFGGDIIFVQFGIFNDICIED